ncbi:MAG: ATP-binding protein [Phycisphaerales bacterium]
MTKRDGIPLLTVQLAQERDVVAARERARQIASLIGFEGQDQIRIATAVSELARNAFVYAGGGRVEFAADIGVSDDALVITVTDSGRGIDDLDHVLSGLYRSTTGMGAGLTGTRRLMDEFDIKTGPSGTRMRIVKRLSRKAQALASSNALARLTGSLAASRAPEPMDELREQNRELLAALDELRRRTEEQTQLNRELDDTNRGVVALHAELEDRAEALRKADELKTWFLSSMSHEFRTPLNSVVAIARLLLDRTDGPLTEEQEHQARLIHSAALQLLDLVNDLLDLAKVKAGRIDIHTSEFTVDSLFGALRASLRPLIANAPVALIFNDDSSLPPLNTDETKLAQILRNFVSNAIKFTPSGAVRVDARITPPSGPDPESILFTVTDTGIGIAPGDLERVFQEFSQVDGPIQRTVKGTGLGLPLSRKLAELIGGRVWAESTAGKGSTFFVSVPRVFYPSTASTTTQVSGHAPASESRRS